MLLRTVILSLAAPLLIGCSGTDCDELDGLRAERDAARTAYQELTSSGSTSSETLQLTESWTG